MEEEKEETDDEGMKYTKKEWREREKSQAHICPTHSSSFSLAIYIQPTGESGRAGGRAEWVLERGKNPGAVVYIHLA